MAQTKKRRRRKRRGTQGGRVDTRPRRSRPRSREEAKARARSRGAARGRGQRPLNPPTWRAAFIKGAVAAVIFFVLMGVLFKREIVPSALLAAFMLVLYVPLSYVTDGFFYRRRLAQAEKSRIERAQRGKGAAS